MTAFKTLISARELHGLLHAGPPGALVLLDCGFDLADPSAGERAYAAGHLPGALYLHLDRDLAGAKTGRNGRHPLPARAAFAARVGELGIGPHTQVVAYDAQGGPYAARAWWMLKWLGHEAVAVLDGGPAAWVAAGGRLEAGATARPASPGQAPPYPLHEPAAMPTVEAAQLQAALPRGTLRLVDARAPERFRGEAEPLDPVAGHIPGAVNHFFKNNLQPDGLFKAPADLRALFAALHTGDERGAAASVVHQCGSGVTACHNLLAMAHAGLAPGALYPGSWSEWCADPLRPVARG